MLVVADNEPARIRNAVLAEAKRRKVPAKIGHLLVGDFLFDDSLCVERKTVPDFVSSVWDGRLFTQAADMEQYSQPYVILTGSFKGLVASPRFWGFTVEQKLRSQCSLLARTKVKLLHVDNLEQFVNVLFILREKSEKGEKTLVVERHSKTINRLDPNMALFLTIPGIGLGMLPKISEDYDTFFDLLRDVRNGKVKTVLSKDGLKYLRGACGLK
jgi:DNA excision repair protein ERCC-4